MTTGKLSQFKDNYGNNIFPISSSNAIFMEDGTTTVQSSITEIDNKTGILSNLTTTSKTNVVSAINELNSSKAPTSHTHTSSDLPSTVAYKDGTLQSGLNAEKVGGKSLSQLLTKTSFTGVDINTIYNTGTQGYCNSCTNTPWGLDGVLIDYYSQYSDLGKQMFIVWDTEITLVRKRTNNTWSSWKKILNQDDYDTLFQYANDGKTLVANAVTGKGVTASSSDTFSTLATKIGQISTGKKFASGSYTHTHTSGQTVITIPISVGFTPTSCILQNLKVFFGNSLQQTDFSSMNICNGLTKFNGDYCRVNVTVSSSAITITFSATGNGFSGYSPDCTISWTVFE